MKSMLGIAICGLLTAAAGRPLMAEAGLGDMPWFAQFGLCGLFGGLLWWAMARTIPKISNDTKEAIVAAAAENGRAAIQVAAEHKEAHIRSSELNSQAIDKLSVSMDSVKAEIRAGNDSQLALLRNVLAEKRGHA